jgi:hypothetical protein
VIDSVQRTYRITASDQRRAGCAPRVLAQAPASKAGTLVRVTLSPGSGHGWCAGLFRGQVWGRGHVALPVGRGMPSQLAAAADGRKVHVPRDARLIAARH